MENPARRFLTTIFGRGLVQKAVGKRTGRGPPAIPDRGRVGDPPPGRPLPQQGCGGGGVQQPVRKGAGLLPGRDEIVPLDHPVSAPNALRPKQGVESVMIEARIRDFRERGLGAISDTEAGFLNHQPVVGAVTDREDILPS